MLANMTASASRFLLPFSVMILVTVACGDGAKETDTRPATTRETLDMTQPQMPQMPEVPWTEKAADYPALKIETVKEGSGDALAVGLTAKFHYTGMLPSGKVFDSSRANYSGEEQPGRTYGEPAEFPFTQGGLIKGWLLGLEGMKEGERRRLLIPPDLGYGSSGSGDRIPPDSPLVFDVELVQITRK